MGTKNAVAAMHLRFFVSKIQPKRMVWKWYGNNTSYFMKKYIPEIFIK
tara:strand:+ start:26 stop:169 length:144 start_codon:yes stop_codon:yes gene_type:complete